MTEKPWMTYDLKELVGRTIAEVWLDTDGNTVAFVLADGGVLKYFACGDCCSESWIENVEVYGGIGSEVLEIIEDKSAPAPTEAETAAADLLQQYALRIRTATGDIAVEHRNNSNGYYGGSLDLCLSDLTGMVKLA